MVGLHSCIAQSYGCTMLIWVLHCMADLSMLISLCGFKHVGSRVASFILTLIYSDPPLAEGPRRVADWCHGDVQAPTGRGKGLT